MTPKEIEQEKQKIDGMTQLEMARLWRFAPSGHPYFDSRLPLHDYFAKRFAKLGGMTPTISKQIGLG